MKTTKKLLICILLIFTLSACTQTEQPHEEIKSENKQPQEQMKSENEQQTMTYSFKNANTNQEFTIIHAYMLYENYFAAVKENPDKLLFPLYKQEILNPIYEACFSGAELTSNPYGMFPEEKDFESIKSLIATMNTDQLNKTFEESLVKSSDILPTDKKTTVCIFPTNESAVSEMMVIGAGKIIVSYSEYDEDYYRPVIAHEYHHSIRLGVEALKKRFQTGLDDLILEGQAVMFETLVYPDYNSAHFVVDENFNKDYWSKMEPFLESVGDWEMFEMIQGGTNGFPSAYGYSEGYKMVRAYLEMHPTMTVDEWTTKTSEEIFEGGNYSANYQ